MTLGDEIVEEILVGDFIGRKPRDPEANRAHYGRV
jgi:hypothetical protein